VAEAPSDLGAGVGCVSYWQYASRSGQLSQCRHRFFDSESIAQQAHESVRKKEVGVRVLPRDKETLR
jgi:hypothetical protein